VRSSLNWFFIGRLPSRMVNQLKLISRFYYGEIKIVFKNLTVIFQPVFSKTKLLN